MSAQGKKNQLMKRVVIPLALLLLFVFVRLFVPGGDAGEQGSGSGPAGTTAVTLEERTSEAASGADSGKVSEKAAGTGAEATSEADEEPVVYGEPYDQAEEVALYLHLYEELPPNYLTKAEARDKGWQAREGNLWEIAPGMSIGGDRFGNREGLLPEKKGRQYYECDIDYKGGSRGPKRLVYSDDGLIFYTEDHYASFEKLY